MSILWIIYFASTVIVACALTGVAVHDHYDHTGEHEGLTPVIVLLGLVLTITPILNTFALIVAASHLVLHTLHCRYEARRLDPKYAKTIPDTVALLDSYTCECMGIKADPRFPDQTSKPDSETKTGI